MENRLAGSVANICTTSKQSRFCEEQLPIYTSAGQPIEDAAGTRAWI